MDMETIEWLIHLHLECSQIHHCEILAQAVTKNSLRIAASYLVSRQQEIETFEYVIDDRRWARIEAAFAEFRHKNEQPNMHPDDTDELE